MSRRPTWTKVTSADHGNAAPQLPHESGFTYVGLLLFLAITGIGLASVGTAWHAHLQREKEAELVFVGSQFQRAIRSYYERSPEAGKLYPKALADLLEDRRSGTVVRHLRRIYVDPMTGQQDWGVIRQPDGRVIGVYSLAEMTVFRTAELPDGIEVKGDTYRDWRFMGNSGSNAPAPSAIASGAPGAGGLPGAIPGATPLPGTDSSGSPSAVKPDEPPPNKCADQRREDMLKCADLREEARPKCESDSARSYATCVRDAARKG